MKICMIGLGSIGLRHLKNIREVLSSRNVGFTIDALRSGNKKADSQNTEFIDNEYYNYDELSDDYDIIFITNPTSKHYDTICKVINKTKHMFIEKPIFNNCSYDIDSIPWKKSGIYYVACPLRYMPIMKYLKDIISHENIYSVRSISSSYLPDWRKGIDYRATYSAHEKLGGGVSLDLIHEWDYITYLFGMPIETHNLKGHFSHLEIDSDDVSIYIAKYKKFLAEIHLDYIGRDPIRKLELFCEKHVISIDLINIKMNFLGNEIEQSKEILFKKEDMYINELNYFFDIVEGKQKNSNDIRHAYEVLKLV